MGWAMKEKRLAGLALAAVLFSVWLFPQAASAVVARQRKPASAPTPAYVPDEVLVKLRAEAARVNGTDAMLARRHGLSHGRRAIVTGKGLSASSYGLDRVFRFVLAPGSEVTQAIPELRSDPAVEYAEPNLIMTVQVAPDDPYYSSTGSWGQTYADMWGLHNIGLADESSGWDIERDEGGSVVVAVIDTGLDFIHPDGPAVWTNPGEIAGDEIDNDGNGFIDDIFGWDFVNGDNGPSDGHGHGTHIAGTIAAETNNGLGVAGISWGSRIMVIKGLSDGGSGSIDGLANAIVYAADNGAHILSNSWGGVGYSQTLEDAVNYAAAAGCLVVAAAGNDAVDVDAFQFVPAVFENAMAVAAVDPQDRAAYLTNHGPAVAVSAPGTDILSLRSAGTDMYGDGTRIVGESYYRASGTSMACPHVSGVAALVWAHHLTWDATRVWNQIERTTDYIDPLNPGLEGRLGSGRINAWKALTVSPQPDLVREKAAVSGAESVLANEALDPGETAGLAITVRNRWLSAAGVLGRLVSSDAFAVVGGTSFSFGMVPEGGTRTVQVPEAITVASGAPYGHELDVALEVEAEGGYQTTLPLGLRVASPTLSLRTATMTDPEGNNNGFLEPGEAAEMVVTLANASRSALAEHVSMTVTTSHQGLSVQQGTADFGSIRPGRAWSNYGSPFALAMAADFPADGTATLRFALSADHGYSATRELELAPHGRRKVFWEQTVLAWPPLYLFPVSAATGPDGSIHTAYQDIRSTLKGIGYAHWSGAFWQPAEPVGLHYTYSYAPTVGVGPSNVPHVGYMETRLAPGWQPIPLTVREFYHSAREPEWTPPRAISDTWSIEALRDYALTVDDRDRVHVAWMFMDWSTPNTLFWYHKLRVDGTWEAKREILRTTDTQRNYALLRLTPGPGGVVWLTWIRNPTGGNTTRELFGARWNGSAWASPTILLATGASLDQYQLAVDGDECLHLVWSDTVVKKRMYKVSQPGGTGWSEPFVFADTPNYAAYNSLYVDGDGIVYVAYNAPGEIRTRVLDNGSWTDEEVLFSLDPEESLHSFRLVTDGRGQRHLVWNSLTDYTLARTQHAMFAAYDLKPVPTPPLLPSLHLR